MKRLVSLMLFVCMMFSVVAYAEPTGDTSDFDFEWGMPSAQQTIPAPSSTPAETPEAVELVISPVPEGTITSPWAKESMDKAYSMGIIPASLVGGDLTAKVSREEFAAISVILYDKLVKGLSLDSQIAGPFNDISDSIYKDSIIRAYNLGITTGTSATEFSPSAFITREQMATMLNRSYNKASNPKWTDKKPEGVIFHVSSDNLFADDGEISEYARESVYFMSGRGVIQGVGDKKFAPKPVAGQDGDYGMATREQALIMALRMTEKFSHK